MTPRDLFLATIPMFLPSWLLLNLMDRNPMQVIGRWVQQLAEAPSDRSVPPVESQLLAYVGVAVFGFLITDRLIPNIQVSQTWRANAMFGNLVTDIWKCICSNTLFYILPTAIHASQRNLRKRSGETRNRTGRETHVRSHLQPPPRMNISRTRTDLYFQ